MRTSRLTITKGGPPSLEQNVASFRTVSLPVLRTCPGFVKAYLLSSDDGTVIAMSVWDSDENMRASEDAVRKLRERFDPHTGPGAPRVERYNVLVEADADGA